jgi:hypothetical protein
MVEMGVFVGAAGIPGVAALGTLCTARRVTLLIEMSDGVDIVPAQRQINQWHAGDDLR